LQLHTFDWVIYVADASNIRRSLLLFSQLADLGLPLILVLNMSDLAQKSGRKIDFEKMAEVLGVPVIWMNARKKSGLGDLRSQLLQDPKDASFKFYQPGKIHAATPGSYVDAVIHSNKHWLDLKFPDTLAIEGWNPSGFQSEDALLKYAAIDELLRFCSAEVPVTNRAFTSRIDKVLTHKVWGYLVFFLVFFLMFQAVFSLAEYPMTWIEERFLSLGRWTGTVLPPGWLTDLFIQGVLSGVSGVVMFVPQIAILFIFLTVLEDSGYMARVSFIMDNVMRRFGLSGRSVVPLIGGMACAVASIMTARSIENRKERLLTILVTPLMSCSARLPVYTLLISILTPPKLILGIFNVQGLLLLLMYIVGVVASVCVAMLLNYFIKSRETSFFVMELPVYRWPVWGNVVSAVWTKCKTFLWEAGRIIVLVAVVLYLLGSYGPANRMESVNLRCEQRAADPLLSPGEAAAICSAEHLENSYLGIMGNAIEPLIAPLGYDWKIGIALLSSLAAREVFVGTMNTIYSLQDEESTESLRVKMQKETNLSTGKPRYNGAVALSLMFFYAFALQCASTVVIVRREVGSAKIALAHFIFLSVLAYISAFLVYHLALPFV
jgi:ferrous iron transport protein B